MSTKEIIFACGMAGVFISCILYVLLGQITVRKLRKNPATKDSLGVEFASGWDIINVAQALALPRSWSRKLDNSALSFFNANAEKMHSHTTLFDKILATFFYWTLYVSALIMIVLIILDGLGVFE